MPKVFRLRSTPAFERDVKSVIKRHKALYQQLSVILGYLNIDPYNLSQQYNIKKLTGVEKGAGQWRIRSGIYRLRYDIFDDEVVLHSFRHRKDIY